MSKLKMDRRQFLQRSLIALGAGGSALASAATCIRTRAQGQGPYYPEADLNRDTDLTRLDPNGVLAEGEIIELSGMIQDSACKPINGALVEIWQANRHGKYEHSQDVNPLPEDPGFQYWGRMTTTADGLYRFLTIVPGHYPLNPRLVGTKPTGPGQYRPPHIHAKVTARGYSSLTTQLYFHPDSYDDTDTQDLVRDLNQWEKVPSDLVVRYSLDAMDKHKPRAGVFSFTLTKR
jgi:protocatechuate 3,4-dioxygenase, beta subunit